MVFCETCVRILLSLAMLSILAAAVYAGGWFTLLCSVAFWMAGFYYGSVEASREKR